MVLDVVVVALSTTLIEPLWGKRELILFFLIINLFVAILTMMHYIVIYTVKGDDVYLYGVKIYGMSGYLAALSVAAKQLMPDSVLIASSIGKMKQDNVPLSALALALFLYLFNLISGMSVVTCMYGLLMAWLYLRFFQFHPTNGTRGDLSESFAFATFFPNVLQPPIAIISNMVYEFLVKLHVCPENTRQYQSVRVLSERLTDNFRLPVRKNKHKYNPSGGKTVYLTVRVSICTYVYSSCLFLSVAFSSTSPVRLSTPSSAESGNVIKRCNRSAEVMQSLSFFTVSWCTQLSQYVQCLSVTNGLSLTVCTQDDMSVTPVCVTPVSHLSVCVRHRGPGSADQAAVICDRAIYCN